MKKTIEQTAFYWYGYYKACLKLKIKEARNYVLSVNTRDNTVS